MTLANAHPLFCGLKSAPSYLANLDVPDGHKAKLMAARKIIRDSLRSNIQKLGLEEQHWQTSYLTEVTARNRQTATVKFMTQGSFAYKTLNVPAQLPMQEIDLDDGMYIPVRFLQNDEPALMASGIFKFVDSVIDDVCKKQGWKPDFTKETCVRIKIWNGAHIDLPIYSIPDDKFQALMEKAERIELANSRGFALDEKLTIPSDKIMLAKRDGNWIHSDPKELHDWVERRAERWGPVYLRLCRFFKGWRDHTWEKSALSSICVMTAVDQALTELNGLPADNRDDEMVLAVAKKLPAILNGKISNPVIPSSTLNDWVSADRQQIIGAAEALKVGLTTALEQTHDAPKVVAALIQQFGTRMPNKPESVVFASTAISSIYQAKPATNPAPRVTNSTSG